ncbi:uncharacterized protein LOC123566688 [Mercenaria mercenaria]|uniref:uncharacterized protein LOC123566688 n=1 Tax=Mercenaria mercenaria TaxID=6596 RepID=UPI00234F35A0|nr:uncharacterized protein LOC123566688 [Mercenaria mercenaria]
MEIKRINALFAFLVILFVLNSIHYVNGGETCSHMEGSHRVQEYCEYGCCGSGNESCCSISTSVLLVACIVSGLVLLALVAAIIICCYKNYKDKQATRVRRLRQEQDMNAPRVPGVEPPKPPSYVSAPPAYSEEMPESHFRPATVTGNIPYNQRFRGTTPLPRRVAHASISMTSASGRHPETNNPRSLRNVQIPGAIEVEAPPPYSEFARGQTPANRRRRFIQSPVPEVTENATQPNVIYSTVEENTDIFSEVSSESGTPSRAQESRAQETSVQPSRAVTSRAVDSRATESRAVTTRAQESRVETIRENESRAETVARVLRPSRISRIPTRVHGAQSRQLSDVQSRASSIPTRQTTNVSTNSSTLHDSPYIRRDPSVIEENIDLAAI